MILPGSEEDLLSLQLDEDHPMFEHKKYEPNYEAMTINGFLALLFLLCGVSAVEEWNRRDGGNMLFLVYGVFFFVGIYFFCIPTRRVQYISIIKIPHDIFGGCLC